MQPTYHIDELYHCESELNIYLICQVAYRSDKRIVSLSFKQEIHQSHLVLTAKT